MTENSKWTRFLPPKLEKWIRGDDDDDTPAAPADAPVDPLLTYQPPGVEWSPDGTAPTGPVCPVCGTEYVATAASDAPCAHCGAERADAGVPAGLADSPTRVLHVEAGFQPRRPCTACGGEVDIDGYCMTCGAKQESERDHFREEPARWLAGVCDRGIRHLRNEDAMALAASQRSQERGVLVVCDGVSTSEDSDVAALAAAQTARDVLSGNQPKGIGTAESRSAAMAQALVEACQAANTAVIEHTALDSANAASATFAAAVVSDGHVFYANLGDSRVYWFPDAGDPVQLSVDDSVAQARIEAGVPREEAENGEGAHAITKWLGRDSADTIPRVGELAPDGPGWLLVCSDGIWNYASLPSDLRTVLADAIAAPSQPTSIIDIAERMVQWANDQGGRDNITVALARLGDLNMLTPVAEAPAAAVTVPAVVPSVGPADEHSTHEPVLFEQPAWTAPPPETPTALDAPSALTAPGALTAPAVSGALTALTAPTAPAAPYVPDAVAERSPTSAGSDEPPGAPEVVVQPPVPPRPSPATPPALVDAGPVDEPTTDAPPAIVVTPPAD